jgi:hypothetical protein
MILKDERILLEERTLAEEERRGNRSDKSTLEQHASKINPVPISVGRDELLLTPTEIRVHLNFLRQAIEIDVTNKREKLFANLFQLLVESQRERGLASESATVNSTSAQR